MAFTSVLKNDEIHQQLRQSILNGKLYGIPKINDINDVYKIGVICKVTFKFHKEKLLYPYSMYLEYISKAKLRGPVNRDEKFRDYSLVYADVIKT